MKTRILQKDTLILIALIIISFFSVYFMPVLVNRLIFLIILFVAYRTKYDYIYLTWFFIINDAPGRLFSGAAIGDVRIPLYSIISGVSLSFQDLFIILYIIKYLSIKRPSLFIFKNAFLLFLTYGIIVFGYSFLFGINADNIISNIRGLMPWSLVLIVPAFLNSKEKILKVSHFLFPIVLFAFMSQIFTYITGNYLEVFMRGVEAESLTEVYEETAIRSYSSVYIILFCIIQAFFFYYNRNRQINTNYLILILFIAFFSIFLTATRGWIVAMGGFLLGGIILFWFTKERLKVFRLVLLSVIFLYLGLSKVPFIEKQIEASYNRLTTLENLARGDITAGGTLSRIDVRSPKVMNKFWESPIFGWGFSDEYYRYQDAHVGHQNILLNVGALGYIFVTGLLLYFCWKIFIISRKTFIRINEGRAPLVYLLGLLTVFIIHTSSTQFWGYLMHFSQLAKILFFSFLFAAFNSLLLNSVTVYGIQKTHVR